MNLLNRTRKKNELEVVGSNHPGEENVQNEANSKEEIPKDNFDNVSIKGIKSFN